MAGLLSGEKLRRREGINGWKEEWELYREVYAARLSDREMI